MSPKRKNKPLRQILLAVCSLALLTGQGATLAYDVTPGKLQQTLSEMPAAGDQLTLTGTIDASDFEALRSLAEVSGLSLDISKLSVVGGRLPDGIFSEAAMKELAWPEGVSVLPTGAVSHSSLEKLRLPATLREIGEYALSGSMSLTAVEGGEGVEKIGERAFAESGVVELSFPHAARLLPYALASAPRLERVTLSRDVQLGRGALADCALLRSVAGLPAELPDLLFALSPSVAPPASGSDVIGIGRYAYAGNATQQLYLHSGLREIERGAFADMAGLTDVNVVSLEGEVPLTDDEAFLGIDCGEVTLHVDRLFTDVWSNHPVWGQFKIKAEESGVENVEADAGQISITCSEGWLSISGDGEERDVEVVTLGGAVLFRGVCRDSLLINLNGCPEKILIVAMTGKQTAKVFLR